MNSLIIKLGATGDVVRTTPLLRRLTGKVTWLSAAKNRSLLEGLPERNVELEVFSWEERDRIAGRAFDLAISLEDDLETVTVLQTVQYRQLFGAHADGHGDMTYTEDSRGWFDLSLISSHGREKADRLKYQNRRTYQELIFDGLGLGFRGEKYLLPATEHSPLQGDVAIAPEAGKVWPMKKWAYYDRLRSELKDCGLTVNVLPTRPTLLEHLADVRGHRCLVSNDSLPMHLALGSGIPCVAIFTCTSPWEIYGYGVLTTLVSPRLGDFFYKRGFDLRATAATTLEQVFNATLAQLEAAKGPASAEQKRTEAMENCLES
jgi:ADP-heptose:LPS heptosyltransferase